VNKKKLENNIKEIIRGRKPKKRTDKTMIKMKRDKKTYNGQQNITLKIK
jgi:hypothetical protein